MSQHILTPDRRRYIIHADTTRAKLLFMEATAAPTTEERYRKRAEAASLLIIAGRIAQEGKE